MGKFFGNGKGERERIEVGAGFHTEEGGPGIPTPRNLGIEYGYYCGAINISHYVTGHTYVPGDYKHWTWGPEDRGPEDLGTRGPEDPKTRDLRTEVLRAVLPSSSYL